MKRKRILLRARTRKFLVGPSPTKITRSMNLATRKKRDVTDVKAFLFDKEESESNFHITQIQKKNKQ